MPTSQEFNFTGASNETLAGRLELPQGPARAFALFAHCFTCGKDIAAAARISRALTRHGIGVLRFDFTGLGGSGGDFGNTTFSSNIGDLVAAANALREHHQAPSLIIGHSLGGTAVLHAAPQIKEVGAVVTIGSPARAEHVTKQFGSQLAAIERDGMGDVDLGGRPFKIGKAFVDDVRNTPSDDLALGGRALLVMHSPIDKIVSIHEAETIYRAAKHPKSFVSLDQADHLLSKKSDADYVADVIAVWAAKFVDSAPGLARPSVTPGEVTLSERDHAFMLDVFSDTHHWIADEPRRVGGQDAGPDPYDHLLAALGTCTTMTMRMYAGRKKWPLQDITTTLRHRREHASDCEGCEPGKTGGQIDVLEREIELIGPLDTEQRARLMEIADRCPVHRTLTGTLQIRTIAKE